MANPDGVTISQTRSASDSVKQMMLARGYSQSKLSYYYGIWKSNANGVDLIRNFDHMWSTVENTGGPSYMNWKGPSLVSEPEQRLVQYTSQTILTQR